MSHPVLRIRITVFIIIRKIWVGSVEDLGRTWEDLGGPGRIWKYLEGSGEDPEKIPEMETSRKGYSERSMLCEQSTVQFNGVGRHGNADSV